MSFTPHAEQARRTHTAKTDQLTGARSGGWITRDKVLLAFDRKSGGTLSGIKLARELGITRTAIWKHIRSLVSDGFPIKTIKRNGYRLENPFDFSLLRMSRHQTMRFWKMHYQHSIPSTQNLAKQAALEGAPEGHFWLAERQTIGRGRLGRVWESPCGGLWFSILLRPTIPPAAVPGLTLVASLCLAEILQEKYKLVAYLKWPNDVVVHTSEGWRKIGGILTEISAELDRTEWVISGIGVNVNNEIPQKLRTIATSISGLLHRIVPRSALLKTFLLHFADAYRQFQKQGFSAFQDAYWKHYGRPGEAIHLKTSQGNLWGIARGVDGHGALIVESKNQLQTVWEGEIV